jgi:competence protein ComEA
MDRSAAPWRVLDDASPSTEPGAPAPEGGGRAGWLTPRLVVGLAAAALIAGAAFMLAATGPVGTVEVGGGSDWPSDGPDDSAGGGAALGGAGEIVVDVQGAVLRPGVQRLAAGSRVGDAIAAAGGYGPRVDAARAAAELNLAEPVKDGDRIVVPARGDPTPGTSGGSAGGGTGGLVDLNTATAAELDALPGVGPVTAQKIIDARAEKPFASVDELRARKIVGAATFEKLRELVTVR